VTETPASLLALPMKMQVKRSPVVVVAVNVLVDPLMAHRLLDLSAHVDSDLLRAVILPQVILHRFLDFDSELFAFTAFKAALIRKRMRLLMSVAMLTGVSIQLAAVRPSAAFQQFGDLVLFISGFTHLFNAVAFFTS
jgi:hypothetical protein